MSEEPILVKGVRWEHPGAGELVLCDAQGKVLFYGHSPDPIYLNLNISGQLYGFVVESLTEGVLFVEHSMEGNHERTSGKNL